MLQNWLKPLSTPLADLANSLPTTAFGGRVVTHHTAFPDLRKARIALIGFEENSADAVRQVLFSYAWAFPPGAIADLGNLRKAEPAHLIPVLFELITGRVMPVVIGGGYEAARAQFMAYQEAKALANWVVIDEALHLPPQHPLSPRHPLLFHFALLGAQLHLLPPAHQQLLEKNNFELLRLGRTRTELEEAEPLLRDADLLSFHMDALKQCEAPALSASPCGFFLEEACQLARYAGMSDKLTSFGIFGLDQNKIPDLQSAHAVAQLIWYFSEGFFNRKGDYPASFKGLSEYVVELPTYNYHLTFWKSELTGRWWLQVPVSAKRKHERHKLIPCSLQDYQLACRQELPDRLFKAFKRF